MKLTEINIYPLKSGAGNAVQSSTVEPRGLKGDRRWMATDEDGGFITARRFPKLVLVRLDIGADWSLRLSAPGMPTLQVAAASAEPREVVVWQSQTTASDAGDQAARWMSDYLETACRIVFQGNNDRRTIEEWPSVQADDTVSFADGYPVLIIGTASLAALNDRLVEPVKMDRFRPNIVVETQIPFVEDSWRQVRIGDCVFDAVKRCARCVLTTIDPQTGTKNPEGEPLSTLHAMRFDADAKGILFGMNLIPRSGGTINLSDRLSFDD